jgi:hypothetical protein
MGKVIWLLLVLYQIKHFVCDYLLQGKYMLGKFAKFPDFILPLLAHVAVHGVTTYLISLPFKPNIAHWFALFDMVIHFTMDRVKASPDLLGRFKPLTESTYKMAQNMSLGLSAVWGESMDGSDISAETMKTYKAQGNKDLRSNTLFWYSIGFDQGVHHLTHYFIIWRLLS